MKKLIVANWKMNPQSQKEAEILLKGTSKAIKGIKSSQIIVCIPYVFLHIFKKLKIKNFSLGAQDVSSFLDGAHTGEVSAKMMQGAGVKYIIVGHSEKRKGGDTDENINKKIENILKSKLSPILCIGESARDNHGFYLNHIKTQIHECLKSIPKAQAKNLIIAYEPVWAIGENATREATASEFTEVKIFIRKVISDMYDSKTAHAVPILYGGSVNTENAKNFLIDASADGLLIGRDSLNPKKFSYIAGIK